MKSRVLCESLMICLPNERPSQAGFRCEDSPVMQKACYVRGVAADMIEFLLGDRQ